MKKIESTEIAVKGVQALAEKPSWIQDNDTRGTENIRKEDMRFPALKIAQSTTPETKRSEAAYIAGLTEGSFFNSITREVYGDETIKIVVINQLGHRNVQFDPADRNVVLDGNVPDGDPRTQFTESIIDGKRVSVKPAATLFYDYLILALVGDAEPDIMTMSLKSTQLKKATALNTILAKSKLPAFAHMFAVTPVPEHKGNNAWYGWRIDTLGWTPEDLGVRASDAYDKFAGKPVVLDAEPDPETEPTPSPDDIPF